MNPIESKLRTLIEREGPIPFSRFMQVALYEPGEGYYMRPAVDPFGRAGDFYTASQLQPVFGRYARRLIESLSPACTHLIDLGAGRQEMREAFDGLSYSAVEFGQAIPETKSAILFANEFFDALPVDVLAEGELLCVGASPSGFHWHPHAPNTGVSEQRPLAAQWLRLAWEAIAAGYFVILDYGYEGDARLRFPAGTLMSYRRHTAVEDVLSDPGGQDISAHVDWDVLRAQAEAIGWRVVSLQSMRRSLLGLGPAVWEELALLDAPQLKSLLFNFAESFDVLILEKAQRTEPASDQSVSRDANAR